MSNRAMLMTLCVLLGTVGCAPTTPFIDQMQPEAVAMAARRGQFEMNCPAATGEVISRQNIPPVIRNPRWGGIDRAEYTIGVSGCGKRATYVVLCPDDGSSASCFAAGGRTEVQQ